MRSLNPTEHQIQAAFVEWCRLHERHYERHYFGLFMGFAVPNGGLRNKNVAQKLKAEGVRAGVLDWCLPVPMGKYCGLFIEFKSKKGVLSADQREEIAYLKIFGWKTVVCHTTEEAIEAIKTYYDK